MPRFGKSFQGSDVSGSSIEDKKDLGLRSEVFSEFFNGLFGPIVGPIGRRMIDIGLSHRFKNERMNSRMIVAAKTALHS
ncbi:hypothetical protein D3C86_1920530 [compost metagenome]